MNIVFQNLFAAGYEGGANWLESSLFSLGQLPQPPTCIVANARPEMLPASLRDSPHVVTFEIERRAQSGGRALAARVVGRALGRRWEDETVAALAARHRVDLWVGFTGFEGLGAERPLLVWYPDFQWRHFPAYFEAQEIADRERQWDYVARRADGLLAISQAVADDALASHPGVAGKIHVCGFPPIFTPSMLALDPEQARRAHHLPERYFVVSNQFWQHKNHALVFEALSRLRRAGKVPPVVAFTGRPHDYRSPDAFSNMLQSVSRQGLHEYCRFLGVVPRAEQIALVRGAEAVVQPSKFEGRGAIAEEASVLGTQLLCSSLPVHRELNLPGALFFPVDDADALAALLERDFRRPVRDAREVAAESLRLAREYGERLLAICERVAWGGRTPQAAA
ncbi:MAG TPA: glycosyltransferase [Pyrinomonadaceae bacterium]|jgi:glycosyltransferase involved in cell wall biosynthesis